MALQIPVGLKYAAAALFAAFLYLSVSSPDAVVVRSSGEIVGTLNVIRAELQGKKFWRNQLALARSRLNNLYSMPSRLQEMQASADAKIQEMYRKYPELAKIAEQKTIPEQLRAEADRMEKAEADSVAQAILVRRILELEQVLPVLEAKAR